MKPVGEQHQLHGVQPVLPVPDVAAAAAWFRDHLGFGVDFTVEEPPRYARVSVGDGSWGAPVYIHLSHSAAPVRPCGATRLHVGHDIDGLHSRLLAAGVTVLLAPTDQPWGLREIEIEAPGGHRLCLGAETQPQQPHEAPRSVIVTYRPKPGQETALLALVRGHVPALQRLGLATDRAPFIMQAADGSIVEVFEWASAEAVSQAHQRPEVQAMWVRFDAACQHGRLAALAEAAGPFAEFRAL
jgi:catechol 2,3-dioxygenase-like lactoylglutathione lyase family enzyme